MRFAPFLLKPAILAVAVVVVISTFMTRSNSSRSASVKPPFVPVELFKVDTCTVYQFRDNYDYHYLAVCDKHTAIK